MTRADTPHRTKRTRRATTPAAGPEQRILTVLAADGWMDIRAIHTALAAQDDGPIPHPDVKAALRSLVDDGRVERAGLTPPRWRTGEQVVARP